MFKKPVWDDLSFVTVYYPAGSSIRRCTQVGCGSSILPSSSIHPSKYSGRLWRWNDAQLVLRGQKCPKKLSPTPSHNHHQPEPLRQGRMDPCFHVLYTKFWLYHLNVRSRNRDSSDQATFLQSSIVRFWWSCVNCILRVLFLSDRSGTRCGLLLLEPICFRVRRVVCSEIVFWISWL